MLAQATSSSQRESGERSAVEVPAKFATYCVREADTPKAVEEVDFNEKQLVELTKLVRKVERGGLGKAGL